MRIGLIPDIDCNAAALDIAPERTGGRVDEVLCTGDAIYQFRCSHGVVRNFRDRGVRVVTANHEDAVLGSQPSPTRRTARSASRSSTTPRGRPRRTARAPAPSSEAAGRPPPAGIAP